MVSHDKAQNVWEKKVCIKAERKIRSERVEKKQKIKYKNMQFVSFHLLLLDTIQF